MDIEELRKEIKAITIEEWFKAIDKYEEGLRKTKDELA